MRKNLDAKLSLRINNLFCGENVGRCQFSRKARSWGWSKFISLEDFKDSSNGYLVKSKCCVEAEVAIVGSSRMESG